MFEIRLSIARCFRAILSLILVIIFFVGYPSQALAQSNQNDSLITRFLVLIGYKQRENLGAPTGRARGGAGRGQCPVLASVGDTPLTALVPTLKPNIYNSLNKKKLPPSYDFVWGQTIEEYPTFWFYIPYQYEELEPEAKFVLLDEEKRIVTGPIFLTLSNKDNLEQKSKIAKFTLPNEQPLEIGKQYNWYFSIICDARKPSRNPGVTGWIQRVKSPMTIPSKQYLYYAQQGIWYDTVTRLADSRVAIPPAQIDDIAPPTGDKSLTIPASQIEEDWLAVIRFLKWSDEKPSDETLIKDIANSPIVELVPRS